MQLFICDVRADDLSISSVLKVYLKKVGCLMLTVSRHVHGIRHVHGNEIDPTLGKGTVG